MPRMLTLSGSVIRDGRPVRAVVTAVAGGQRYDAWTQDSNIPGINRPGVFSLQVPDSVTEIYVTEMAAIPLGLKEAPVAYVGGNAWRCSMVDVRQLAARPREMVILTLLSDRRSIRVTRSTTTAGGPLALSAFGWRPQVA
jgi:hypothetical protein